MLDPDVPTLILAPMQGMTDAPMRAFLSEQGGWTFAVAEFMRVSSHAPAPEIFRRHVPELRTGGRTHTGLPVQVQLLGGDAALMAQAAAYAVEAGARAVDINFGCPAKTVNRHDGGATLLKYPARIQEIVSAVRGAVPVDLPVSAKIRLGWDSTDLLLEIADRAATGGASWLTIHGRTRAQGYAPPAYWNPIGEVRARLSIPVVANGDLWTVEDLRRCRAETGCRHFMLGRGAVADPTLARRCAVELGILPAGAADGERVGDWGLALRRLACLTERIEGKVSPRIVCRWKQWLKLAEQHGGFVGFEAVKRAETMEDVLAALREGVLGEVSPVRRGDLPPAPPPEGSNLVRSYKRRGAACRTLILLPRPPLLVRLPLALTPPLEEGPGGVLRNRPLDPQHTLAHCHRLRLVGGGVSDDIAVQGHIPAVR